MASLKPFLGWWAGSWLAWTVFIAVRTRKDVFPLGAPLFLSLLTATFIWGVFY